ncbi:unnamed protein product [Prunus armeniaca]|uniref:Uncharacterized protein n=1 Tax=Prunus armeniaca TaxID=36596 RepID=A0A6J5VBA1_PRUAR|nr:unnamed protein product [Prunus armeniaca]
MTKDQAQPQDPFLRGEWSPFIGEGEPSLLVGTQNRRQSIELVFLLLLIKGRLVKVVVYGFGQDVAGAVETGSGKKQAFGLPIFAMLVGGRRKHCEGRVVATCMKLGARGATHVEGVTRVDLSENTSFSNLLLINGTARLLKW